MSIPAIVSRRIGSYICTHCRIQSRKIHASRSQLQQRDVLARLEERGLINQIAGDRNVLSRFLQTKRVGAYAGIDPTAPSLHLGHLLPLMVLFWLYHDGHHTVSLVGGGTARVGDPSGRLTSRAATIKAVHDTNLESMLVQVDGLWEKATKLGQRRGISGDKEGRREVVNNAEWLGGLNILDFLGTMGTVMRLGTMLGRDTVRNKMEKGDGMSFAEFSYPLLQGWDWWQMYRDRNVQLQIGGGDQYGNIVAGMDAVRQIAQAKHQDGPQSGLDEPPMGITVPLLTTSTGEKFGKSAGNAVWLDANLTSPFDLYGFLLRSTDEDVVRYLKLFTFLPVTEIQSVLQEHERDPAKRRAQHLLAKEVLELVHGPEEAERTQAQHQSLRKPTLSSLTSQAVPNAETENNGVSSEEPRVQLPISSIRDTTFANVLYETGLVSSKSEGRRAITSGKVYVGSAVDSDSLEFVQVRDQENAAVIDFVNHGLLVFRMGKWKVRIIEVMDDSSAA